MKTSQIRKDLQEIALLRVARLRIQNATGADRFPRFTWEVAKREEINTVARKASMAVLKDSLTPAGFKASVLAKIDARLTVLLNKFPFEIEED